MAAETGTSDLTETEFGMMLDWGEGTPHIRLNAQKVLIP